MRKSFIYFAALALIAACNKVESPTPSQDSNIITAQIEQYAATKTYMDNNNNIRWSEGDQVIAFMKSSYGHKYQLVSSFVGKTSADFSIVSSDSGNLSAGSEWDHNIVYYPYSNAIEAAKSGSNYSLNVVLPSEQTYVSESFGNGSMAMVAVSENNNITFRNVLGGMKLQLRGTQMVKSISLQGKNNEKLSGAATVTAYTDEETKPTITMTSGASKYVTLNCGGVQLNESTATEFIVALPPVLFSKGFTAIVTDAAGKTYAMESDNTNEVLRSSILVMPAITLENPEQTLNDYIDEYGINHGKGTKIGETVWAPVNCGYHKDNFTYGKLYQWGRKYGQGYGNRYGIDTSLPDILTGPVSLEVGQSKSNENYFYANNYSPNDWVDISNNQLWNSGTESNPVKTTYDPCPAGWRVPTYAELDELSKNFSSWIRDEKGRLGLWFSGPNPYTETVPKAFFPAAGRRLEEGRDNNRDYTGSYWSSMTSSSFAQLLYFSNPTEPIRAQMYFNERARGLSVRCVQE